MAPAVRAANASDVAATPSIIAAAFIFPLFCCAPADWDMVVIFVCCLGISEGNLLEQWAILISPVSWVISQASRCVEAKCDLWAEGSQRCCDGMCMASVVLWNPQKQKKTKQNKNCSRICSDREIDNKNVQTATPDIRSIRDFGYSVWLDRFHSPGNYKMLLTRYDNGR